MSERKKLGDTGWIDPLDREYANYGKIILYEHAFRYKLVANDILQLLKGSGWNTEIRILDIGGGTGYGSKILFSFLCDFLKAKKHRVRYLSTDIDEKAIREGKKYLFSNSVFSSAIQLGNVYHISEDFEKESFDVIIFFEVIEHLKQPALSLREISTVLKNRGRLYLSSPNKEYPPRMIYNKIRGINSLTNPTHIFEFNWQEFRNFVERLQGWKVVQLFGQNVLPPNVGDFILKFMPKKFHFDVIMTPGKYIPRFSRNFIAIMEKCS